MGEDEFDFGSLFGGGDTDMSNFDMSGLDLGSLADLGDLSNFDIGDLGNFNLGDLDLGGMDFNGQSGIDIDSILKDLGGDVGGIDPKLLESITGYSPDKSMFSDDAIQTASLNATPIARQELNIAPGDYAPLEDQLAELMGTGSTKTENLGMGDMAENAGGAYDQDYSNINALEALMGKDLSSPSEEDIRNLGLGDLSENVGGTKDVMKPWVPKQNNPNLESGKTIEQRLADQEQQMKDAENRNVYDQEDMEAGLASIAPQDLGISQKNIDEAQSVFAQNKTPSGWQKVGSDLVNVRDDGTANAINTKTGKSYSLTADQVAKMDKQGLLESKTSGYVDATGGKGFVPGGGKTIENADGTKTVITTDGKVLTTNKDGTIVDTGKKVDVNNSALDTIKDTVTKNTDDVVKKLADAAKTAATTTKTGTASTSGSGNNMGTLMMLMALMAMMNKGGGSSGSSGATIPSLSADRKQLPYGGGASNYRPGQGGVNYFTPTTYTTKAAGGGLMSLNAGGHLGGYSDGGRLLRGPGDGVSDSIPATIGGKQPARLATGEFVVPARIVSELGNGSTDAGAQRLYEMMDRVQHARRKTKNVAANTKAAKYLPA